MREKPMVKLSDSDQSQAILENVAAPWTISALAPRPFVAGQRQIVWGSKVGGQKECRNGEEEETSLFHNLI